MTDLPSPDRRAEPPPEQARADLVQAYETLLRSQSGTTPSAGSRTAPEPRDALDLASAYDGLLKSEAAKRTARRTPELVRKSRAKTAIVVVLVLFQLYLWFADPKWFF